MYDIIFRTIFIDLVICVLCIYIFIYRNCMIKIKVEYTHFVINTKKNVYLNNVLVHYRYS